MWENRQQQPHELGVLHYGGRNAAELMNTLDECIVGKVMDAIDENVKFHVDYFVGQLTQEERESALSILMFYVGAKL